MEKQSVQIAVLGARDLPDLMEKFTVQTVITKYGASILGSNHCIFVAYYTLCITTCRWWCV